MRRRLARGLAAAVALAALLLALAVATDRPSQKRARASAPLARLPGESAVARSAGPFPRYDEVYGKATHNSYFTGARPHEAPWPLAPVTGTEERLQDQLLWEGVRAIEIDVHRAAPGEWAIYHTCSRENSRFATLADALDGLRVFHRALPRHECVNVIVELKETWPVWPLASARAFDEAHAIGAFDDLLRRSLGDALYTPADLLARAPGALDLLEAGEAAGWPTTQELRGRFIVNVLGNWSDATSEWARYATAEGGARARAAFPMRSIMGADGSGESGWPGGAHEEIPAATLEAARRASIFWQLEDLRFDARLVERFLGEQHGVARASSAFSREEQRPRIARGVQLIQTDFPWHFEDLAAPGSAPAPYDPRRRLFDAARATGRPAIGLGALLEPGERIRLSSRGPYFRWREVGPEARRSLEAVVAGSTPSGEDAFPETACVEGAAGALRVESEDGAEWIEVGRALDDGGRGALVAFARGVARGERVDVRLGAGPREPGEVGEMVRLSLENLGAGGARVEAFSAGRLDAGGEPAWRSLGAFTLARPARRLGLAIPRGEALFVRTRDGGDVVRLADLPGERAEGAGAAAEELGVVE